MARVAHAAHVARVAHEPLVRLRVLLERDEDQGIVKLSGFLYVI